MIKYAYDSVNNSTTNRVGEKDKMKKAYNSRRATFPEALLAMIIWFVSNVLISADNPATVTIEPSPIYVCEGHTFLARGTVSPADAYPRVTFVMDAPSTATVTPGTAIGEETALTITGVKVGKTTLRGFVDKVEKTSVEVNVCKLRIKRNGTDITDQTITASIGEKIALTAEFDPVMTITSNTWTIPDKVIKNYEATLEKATVTELPVADLSKPAVAFYWLTDGTKDVSVTALAQGCQCSAKTRFNVEKPGSTLISKTGSVAVGNSGFPGSPPDELFFGSLAARGIAFTATFTPTAATAGKTEYWQVINNIEFALHFPPSNRGDNEHFVDTATGSNILDTKLPITKELTTSDSPSIRLSYEFHSKVSRSDSFSMYFMFKPNTADAIWVPLRKVDWSWSGTAKLDAEDRTWWKLEPGSTNSVNPASIETTNEPIWSGSFPSALTTTGKVLVPGP